MSLISAGICKKCGSSTFHQSPQSTRETVHKVLHAVELSHNVGTKCLVNGVSGPLNAVSVMANGQSSHLKCFCREVICHVRGFPQLGVGLSIREGKADFFFFLNVYPRKVTSYGSASHKEFLMSPFLD